MPQITHLQDVDSELNISHVPSLQETIDATKKRLKQLPKPILPLDQSLDLLDQLSQFELGRFLLLNRGCNGYWTSYLTLPFLRKGPFHPLEEWLLTKAPGILSLRERFKIFQQQAQQYLKPDMVIASIPCGLMDDLLSLDYEGFESVEIVGVDIDIESLQQAQDNSCHYNMKNKITFFTKGCLGLKNE